MSIQPLDMQVLYAQQSVVSRSEHSRLVERALVQQIEDVKLSRDNYEKDSTVVRNNSAAESQTVKEREGGRRQMPFVMYRRRKNDRGEDEIVVEESTGGGVAVRGGIGGKVNILQ